MLFWKQYEEGYFNLIAHPAGQPEYTDIDFNLYISVFRISMQQMTFSMKASRFVALLGSIITLVQIVLLVNEKDGICLNDGCRVVDSLTTIPPILFSVGGFLFFQTIFWGIWFAGKNRKDFRFVNIVLLAALAAEGVLLSFQYFVAQTFCSYCLIILALVVLLNILAGARQIIGGAAIFAAILLSFTALQFSGSSLSLERLDSGTFAVLKGSEKEKHYLFFSSTCGYCEEVILSLQDDTCAIRFNPIDEISEFALEDAQRLEEYEPSVNRAVLQSLGLNQIPVLLVSGESGFQVINGSAPIRDYLGEHCRVRQEEPAVHESSGFSQSSPLDYLLPQDEACSVDVECDDPELLPGEK